ncbi:MAG: SelB C-terminal domain-containing protein, partial [Chthoniobacterales bacterium]
FHSVSSTSVIASSVISVLSGEAVAVHVGAERRTNDVVAQALLGGIVAMGAVLALRVGVEPAAHAGRGLLVDADAQPVQHLMSDHERIGDEEAIVAAALQADADEAIRRLAALPQPFTLSEARQALDTTRRVAVPLLEALDRQGGTRRIDSTRRAVVTAPVP